MTQNWKRQLKELPQSPGVYLFRDARKTVLYIGKATRLKDRVRQYVSGQEEKSRGARMMRLMTHAQSVDVQETESVLEALLLEAELIKKYQPQYNIEGKDDKSFSYLVVTYEDFPRVVLLRATDFHKTQYQTTEYTKGAVFGPYTSRKQIAVALKLIRKIFPFHDRKEKTEKGCLAYHIGLCPGPYDGAISRADYRRNIRHIKLFLRGRKKAVVTALEKQMHTAAKREAFEDAEKIKRQIFALTHLRDVALLQDDRTIGREGTRIECYDISHLGGDDMVASMAVFVDGTPDKGAYRKFKVQSVEGIDDVGAMREVLARRVRHTEWAYPDVIVLDGGKGHLAMAEDLWHKLDLRIPLLAVAKGPTRKNVDVRPSTVFPPEQRIVEDRTILEHAREEAHRFAIAYHKKLRRRSWG